MKYALNELLKKYSEKNSDNLYEPVAVGKYGIRKRSEIYKKELAKDYSNNKVIHKDTLTIGLGSKQIDFGVLLEDKSYSVSPAYSTFIINTDLVSSAYLELCLVGNNEYFTQKYMIASARQGKKVDIDNLLTEMIEVPDFPEQLLIVENISVIKDSREKDEVLIQKLDELVKARFIEMFGDPISNPMGFEKNQLKNTCDVITGNTPSRSVKEYYGDYIEWIKTDNIVPGLINPTSAAESLSKKGLEVGKSVEANSILMACIAGSIASIGKVCVTDRKVTFNQQINAVVPKQYNVLFLYTLLQLSKDYLVEGVNLALKGILSKSKLEEKEFIVPRIEIQNQFAEFVEEVLLTKKDILKRQELYDELFAKKMNEYFLK